MHPLHLVFCLRQITMYIYCFGPGKCLHTKKLVIRIIAVLQNITFTRNRFYKLKMATIFLKMVEIKTF